MIITESFVCINYPKSGSTFVREILKSIYQPEILSRFSDSGTEGRWIKEVRVPELRLKRGTSRRGVPTPHGTVSQIPEDYSDLPVMASSRDPLALIISAYGFADWKKKDVWPAKLEDIKSHFPGFPELSLNDYVDFCYHYYKSQIKIGDDLYEVGAYSRDLLAFYSCKQLDANEIPEFQSWDAFWGNLASVCLLNNESLSVELAKFLSKYNFNELCEDHVINYPKLNVTKYQDVEKPVLDEAAQKRIVESESLYYAIQKYIIMGETTKI